jgi:hypothetical protein
MYLSTEEDEVTAEWNLFRSEVLRIALNELYATFQKETSKQL